MKKLMMMFAVGAAILMTGCSVTKVDYKKDADGICEYRIYHNDHWLKRETGAMSGGMTNDGKFEVKLESASVSPSEEFNRTMQTYTSAAVQLARIAAAAYNPSASAVPLTNEAADPEAVAKLVAAQSEAKTAEIAAKSQRETNRIAAQAAAQAATKSSASATATTDCKDGNCTDGTCTDGSCSKPQTETLNGI